VPRFGEPTGSVNRLSGEYRFNIPVVSRVTVLGHSSGELSRMSCSSYAR
jgi:hypothetical protein